jgi:hypothetical protein
MSMSASSISSHYIFGFFFGKNPYNYIALGMLLLLTLYCLSSSFSRGMANAWYFNAEFSLNDWAKNNTITDKAEYLDTLTSIKKAQTLDSKHPHYAHMLGRIMHGGVDMGIEDTTALVDIDQWYVLSTQLRPLWPEPWIDLARLNNALHGYDDLTKYYIDQALATGPYLDLVTVGTFRVLLLNWQVLSGQERELLFKQFDIATMQYKVLNQVLEFAKDINRDKLLCSQLKFNPKYLKQKEWYPYRKYCLK